MEFSNETRKKAKIGVLVPFTNTNLEPDLMMMRPKDTTLHFQRLGGYDVDEVPGSDQMAGLGACDIRHDLKMICGVRPDVVLYGCTSATLTHGNAFDQDLSTKISSLSGTISLTAAGALVFALQALQISRVGFSSPYLGEINAQAMSFLRDHTISTVRCADIGRALGNYGQGELTPEEVFDLALKADHPNAEAIVLSRTDMRSVEVIERIEETLNKPVITSNQAMMYGLCRALKLDREPHFPGRLFDKL